MSPSETDWAYLAGFFDGEGTITASVGRDWRPRLKVTQRTSYVIEHLYYLFGVGSFRTYLNQRDQKTVYAWEVGRKQEVRYLLQGMLPYLIVKEEQAELALWASSLRLAERRELYV